MRHGRWLAVVLLALALTGCGKEVAKGPTKAERVIGDGISVDLAAPPVRADLGLDSGDTTLTLALPERKPFEALVYFSNGQTLQAEVNEFTVTSGSETGNPDALELVDSGMTRDELRRSLDDAVRTFGADPAEAELLLGMQPGAEAATLATAQAGAEELMLELAVDADTGEYALTWQVGWMAAPSK